MTATIDRKGRITFHRIVTVVMKEGQVRAWQPAGILEREGARLVVWFWFISLTLFLFPSTVVLEQAYLGARVCATMTAEVSACFPSEVSCIVKTWLNPLLVCDCCRGDLSLGKTRLPPFPLRRKCMPRLST